MVIGRGSAGDNAVGRSVRRESNPFRRTAPELEASSQPTLRQALDHALRDERHARSGEFAGAVGSGAALISLGLAVLYAVGAISSYGSMQAGHVGRAFQLLPIPDQLGAGVAVVVRFKTLLVIALVLSLAAAVHYAALLHQPEPNHERATEAAPIPQAESTPNEADQNPTNSPDGGVGFGLLFWGLLLVLAVVFILLTQPWTTIAEEAIAVVAGVGATLVVASLFQYPSRLARSLSALAVLLAFIVYAAAGALLDARPPDRIHIELNHAAPVDALYIANSGGEVIAAYLEVRSYGFRSVKFAASNSLKVRSPGTQVR